jgi:hypothetical protein
MSNPWRCQCIGHHLHPSIHPTQPTPSSYPAPQQACPAATTKTSPNVSTAAVTRDIISNTLTQLSGETAIKGKDVIGQYTSRGLRGVSLIFYLGSHRLTVHVDYETTIFSSVNAIFFMFSNNLLKTSHLMKKRGGNLTPRSKNVFYKDEMHDVLHCAGSTSVKVAPSPRHTSYFTFSSEECMRASFVLFMTSYVGLKRVTNLQPPPSN